MDLAKVASESTDSILANVEDVHWSHHVAAATLIAGAILLITGRKRQALMIAAAGAVTTILERPEAAQDLWKELPTHIRNGQDFLVRAETFIEKLGEQAGKLREAVSRQA